MKWILLIAVIGLSIFAYNQQRSLDEERIKLQKAQAQIVDLEKQIPKMKPRNPFLPPLPANANNSQSPQGPWKGGSTALDSPAQNGEGGHGRGRK